TPPLPAGWTDYADATTGFAVHFPAQPTEQRITRDAVDVDVFSAGPVNGVTFLVMTSAAGKQGMEADKSMQTALNGLANNMKARATWKSRSAPPGRPALDTVLEANGAVMRDRIVIGNERMYILSVTAPAGTPRDGEQAFLDSFRITK